MSISDAEKLTPSAIGKAFHERYVQRSKAFLEQGKLVYALQQKKLNKGQTVQTILTSKGIPNGSVNNARTASAVIEKLVVTNIVDEHTFDNVATFRLVRNSHKLLGLGRKDEPVMSAEKLGEIISQKAKPSALGTILDVWVEHGKSPEDHEADLKAQAEAEKQAEIDAAKTPEAETPEAETPEAETPEAETPEAETPEAETPEAETPEAETPETETPETETPEAETPETETPEGFKEIDCEELKDGITQAAPPANPVDAVLEALQQVRLKTYDLDADGLKAVLLNVNEFQQEIIDSLKAHKEAEEKQSLAA